MNSTISLKLFSYGIQKLHDPNWTGMDLYDKLKQHLRQRVEPKNMIYETIQNGLLLHLGIWIYEEYLLHYEEEFIELEGEYLLWYLEDYIHFLTELGVNEGDELIVDAIEILISYNDLLNAEDEDENEETTVEDEYSYYKRIKKDDLKIIALLVNMTEKFEGIIQADKVKYAQDFAERVFHDRVLCEFISKLLLVIGFDGAEEDEQPEQWIKRMCLPNWAKKAVISRDRGHCAKCGAAVSMELTSNHHFDHIIPLFQGGTNDLSNFQLLCEKCNLQKSSNIVSVNTSIPRYLQLKKAKKS